MPAEEAEPAGLSAAQVPPPFDEATALTGRDGHYAAELSSAYRTATGPFGGYLATIALRAAAAATDKPKPASLTCHFLGVGEPGPVQVEVKQRHETRRAASLSVEFSQDERPLLSAAAWFVTESTGIDHDAPQVPHAPPVRLVRPFGQVHKSHGFWFMESRPVYEPSLAQSDPPGDGPWSLNQLEYFVDEHDPAMRSWIRMLPSGTYDDPALDAGRALVAADWLIPFVAAARYSGRRVVLHSSLDLAVNFHEACPGSEWLYCDARVGVARAGISHGEARVWSDNGALIATAMQQMVQRIRL